MLAAIFLGERVTRSKAITLASGLIGVGLIAGPALARSDAYSASGAALALGASGGLAVGSVIVKRMGRQPDVLALTTWQLILGSLPLLAISALVEYDAEVRWELPFVGLLLFLAFVGTSLTSALWYWLVQHGDVGRLSLYFFLIPVFGLALAAMVFGERVSPIESVGVLLILAGIGVLGWESRIDSPPPAPVSLQARRGDITTHGP